MVNGIEHHELDNGYKEAWQVYNNIIKPWMNVAVVGPSESLFIDPVLFAVSAKMAEGQGVLTVIDPSRRNSGSHLDPDIERRVAGAGNVDAYLKQLHTLRSIGIPVKEPEHREGAHIMNFCLKPESLHIICDHNTSPFIVNCGSMEYRGEEERKSELERIYQNYARYLARGGYIILQTDNAKYGFSTDGEVRDYSLYRILQLAGFDVTHYKVWDQHKIPIDGAFRDAFVNQMVSESDTEYFYPAQHIIQDGRNMYVAISPQQGVGLQHGSPDLYLARKQ